VVGCPKERTLGVLMDCVVEVAVDQLVGLPWLPIQGR
jgi:hypothetical protein